VNQEHTLVFYCLAFLLSSKMSLDTFEIVVGAFHGRLPIEQIPNSLFDHLACPHLALVRAGAVSNTNC